MQRSIRSWLVQVGEHKLDFYVTDGDVGCGAPGTPQWHRSWIMQLEGEQLCEYVMTIGVDKTIEAFDGDRTERH